jgi:hypothetical protein
MVHLEDEMCICPNEDSIVKPTKLCFKKEGELRASDSHL